MLRKTMREGTPLRSADAKQQPNGQPYSIDIRVTFDQRIQETVLCSLLDDMRLALQDNYPLMKIQMIGDDAVCPGERAAKRGSDTDTGLQG
jgi:hypothetical protein